jgi:predicted DCC family thiol-disulfide oxidoreductase YuxK
VTRALTERLALANGWTGGQYSLVRMALGLYLALHFANLVPYGKELFSSEGSLPDALASPIAYAFPNVLSFFDAPSFVVAFLLAAVAASVLLVLGYRDRAAAVFLWYVWACLFGRNPLIGNPGLPYVGFLLLAHAFLPPAPYGSLVARGRRDPGGDWRLSPGIFGVAWTLMAVGYSYSGLTKLVSPSWTDGSALARVLDNPLARPGIFREALFLLPDTALRLGTWGALLLEILFAPLALVRRLRPWLWLTLLLLHLSLILIIDFADLSLGMVLLHFFTFDPAWVKAKTGGVERLFYDGSCALCHGAVRFVLAEDRDGKAFRFAPLDSEAFRKMAPPETLPDSLVVATSDGRLLTRSEGVLHILERLGGLWRVVATICRPIPRPLRDAAYDFVARVRYRVFGRKDEACPLIPPTLRGRFDL